MALCTHLASGTAENWVWAPTSFQGTECLSWWRASRSQWGRWPAGVDIQWHLQVNVWWQQIRHVIYLFPLNNQLRLIFSVGFPLPSILLKSYRMLSNRGIKYCSMLQTPLIVLVSFRGKCVHVRPRSVRTARPWDIHLWVPGAAFGWALQEGTSLSGGLWRKPHRCHYG